MYNILSTDSTPLGCEVAGSGQPLVLVHGTGGSATRWKPVMPQLAERFKVYAMDRRGRGESGDGPDYSLAREVADVAAVVDSIGEPVYLLGHSFGGLCSLEAGLLTPNLKKLILYEPPIPVTGVSAPSLDTNLIERLEALVAQDDRAGVLLTFVEEVLRMGPEAREAYKASPAWPGRLAAAHTLPREMRAQGKYKFEAERFKNLNVPTLLLLGGASPERFQAATDVLKSALPNSQTVILPGQGHIAMDTAPQLFVDEVVRFLEG
jgi:pimeloyl-ACP methyl ester carboxylesterase